MKKFLLVFALASIFATACQKTQENVKPETASKARNNKSGSTSNRTDEQREEMLKQISYILTEVIKTNGITQEVMNGVKSEYYDDESILIYDLLNPSQSPIGSFQQNASAMQFESAFQTAFNQGMYMFAQNYTSITYAELLAFIQEDNVAIYFPYSENFTGTEMPTLTYNTIEERDDNVGYAPTVNAGRIDGFTRTTVNDDYANANSVWVTKARSRGASKIEDPIDGGVGAGSGGNPVATRPGPVVLPIFSCNYFNNPNNTYKIFVGDLRVREQLDPFFGFNNSGGCEMVVTRGFVIGSLTNPSADTKQIFLPKTTRKAIKEKRWVAVDQEFEVNWDPTETQFVVGFYEQDYNEVNLTISGTAKAVLSLKDPVTGATTSGEVGIGASATFNSMNSVQYQQDYKRCEYFKEAGVAIPSYIELYQGWKIHKGQYSDFTLPYVIF